jgi:hypothetical protein
LAADASCTLVVNFAPTSTIYYLGELTANASLAGTATADLSGGGI